MRCLVFSYLVIKHQIKLEWWQYLTHGPKKKSSVFDGVFGQEDGIFGHLPPLGVYISGAEDLLRLESFPKLPFNKCRSIKVEVRWEGFECQKVVEN